MANYCERNEGAYELKEKAQINFESTPGIRVY